jgi:hypothetical protein
MFDSPLLPENDIVILDNHPFKLRKFSNLAFNMAHTLPFLAAHPEIIIWHDTCIHECTVPPDILPNVRDLYAPVWILSHIQYRPLTHLSLTEIRREGERLLETLSSLKATLKVLYVEGVMQNPSHALIGTLAKYVPDLEELSISYTSPFVSQLLRRCNV